MHLPHELVEALNGPLFLGQRGDEGSMATKLGLVIRGAQFPFLHTATHAVVCRKSLARLTAATDNTTLSTASAAMKR